MKKITLVFSCLLALLSAPVGANEEGSQELVMAQRCLTSGLEKLKANNPGLHAKLQAAIPDPSTAILERFDENIGSQHIATLVTASLKTDHGVTGEMLCLLENDEPLFVDFHNLDE